MQILLVFEFSSNYLKICYLRSKPHVKVEQVPLREVFFSAQRLIIVICKKRIVSCYTFTEIQKYTDARRPPDRHGVIQYMPSRPRRDV